MEHGAPSSLGKPVRDPLNRWYGSPLHSTIGRGRRIAGCAPEALLVEGVKTSGIREIPWLRLVAAGLLAGLLALALPPSSQRDTRISSPYTAGHAALVTAGGGTRALEPRLSGGFAFGPWPANPPRGGAPTQDELAAEALAEGEGSWEPTTLGTRAVLELRRGRPGEAIRLLERAVEETPEDPRLQSDLAAAYLERAETEDEPRDLVAALGAAGRGIALDDRFSEAAFNRALALERLQLWEVAAEAWERVTELEADPGWRDEARERHVRLRSRPSYAETWQAARGEILTAIRGGDRSSLLELVVHHPQAVRQWAQDELLGEWAEAVTGGYLD